jgi:hypothetical protein
MLAPNEEIDMSNVHFDRTVTELNLDGLTDAQNRLFAVRCARRVQHLMTDPRSIKALDVAERHANGQATDAELEEAGTAAQAAWVRVCEGVEWETIDPASNPASDPAWAARSALCTTDSSAARAARAAAKASKSATGIAAARAVKSAARYAECEVQKTLLEEIKQEMTR